MRGGGSAPTDLRTFARSPTIPKEVADVSIYDKGPEPESPGSINGERRAG
jgi:hypothetical protein